MPHVSRPLPPSRAPLALFVDPDPDTRGMYAQCLQLAGYETDEAADGREGLAKALSLRPAAVIMETRLNGISGYDLCLLMRRDAATRDTPIVVVTASTFPEELIRARSVGADAVMSKPCLPDTLLAEISRVIGRRAGARASARNAPSVEAPKAGRIAARDHDPRPGSPQPLSKTHHRGATTTPPLAPCELVCPQCDRPLTYESSELGGVNAHNSEQWDYYVCSGGCGHFQYRQRTRKLRMVFADAV